VKGYPTQRTVNSLQIKSLHCKHASLQILLDFQSFSETSIISHWWLDAEKKLSSQKCKAHGHNATILAVNINQNTVTASLTLQVVNW